MADRCSWTAGVEHIEQVSAVVLALIVTASLVVVPIPLSNGQAVGKQATGEDPVGENQGAVLANAKRGGRALSPIRIVGPGAIVFGGAFSIDDEQQAMVWVELNASRGSERVDRR